MVLSTGGHRRVGGRRTCRRIRWQFRRFRSGPQSGFPNRVSSRRSPNRACGTTAPGSPGGSCNSHSDNGVAPWSFSFFQRLARSLFPLHALSPLVIRPVYALITPRGVPGTPHGSFTFACDAAEVSDHVPVSRSLPMPWPFPLRTSLRTCGPFPPRALPRLYGTTSHSATLSARPDPCGLPVGVCCTADRASRVATPSILHACQCQYPGGNSPVHVSFTSRTISGLPLVTGGSASALHVSRPAQHSLRVPACMLAESPM